MSLRQPRARTTPPEPPEPARPPGPPHDSALPAIRVRDVVIRDRHPHDQDVLLDRVSLTLPWGSFAVLTGESGAGKTTLLRAVAGQVPHDGVIEVAGREIGGGDALPHVRLLSAQVELPSILTAQEYVTLAAMAAGHPARAAHDRAVSALAALGLGESGRHLVEELSGGQRQRLVLAAVIAAPPWVLLADEPTSALDAANRELVLQSLRALAAEGHAVLVATHDETLAGPDDTRHHLCGGHLDP